MTTYEELRAAAMAATPQDLDTSQYITSYELYECPLCGGDGSVEGLDFCNFDDFAIGVQIYGIGEKMVACEQYWRKASPRKIISLLDELNAKDARIAKLEADLTKAREAFADLRRAAWNLAGEVGSFEDHEIWSSIEQADNALGGK